MLNGLKVVKETVFEDSTIQELPKVERGITTLDYGESYNQMNLSEVPPVHDIGFKPVMVFLSGL